MNAEDFRLAGSTAEGVVLLAPAEDSSTVYVTIDRAAIADHFHLAASTPESRRIAVASCLRRIQALALAKYQQKDLIVRQVNRVRVVYITIDRLDGVS